MQPARRRAPRVSTLAAAKSDPDGFVDALPERVVLDEVQRVPELFRAIKRSRRAGRYRRLAVSCLKLHSALPNGFAAFPESLSWRDLRASTRAGWREVSRKKASVRRRPWFLDGRPAPE